MMSEDCMKYPKLLMIGVLNNKNILIKDKEKTERLVSEIVDGKFDALQLITDFDYTLSRGHFSNEKSHCSWGILDNSSHMPPFYRKKASELFNKYYPIEIDAKMSELEKIPHMSEWYLNIADLLKQCKLSKKALREMVAESNVKFRYDTDELFKKLRDQDVPVLIFSAGMGDVLEHVLWYFDVYSQNVRVISNFFKYDDEGIMVDFKGELIHMFNKNENAVHSSNYFEDLHHRTNVILLGDSLGDAKMALGVPKSSNVLKIGFFNHDIVSERIEAYKSTFDIVLLHDQTMSVANNILAQIKQ